ncbi:hypothetical protein B0H13DRAFT_2395183 [Mycena leptocephala]|nr:hypothetical protein B0H13DRAFT_2395183 [Mycena leptocephala]
MPHALQHHQSGPGVALADYNELGRTGTLPLAPEFELNAEADADKADADNEGVNEAKKRLVGAAVEEGAQYNSHPSITASSFKEKSHCMTTHAAQTQEVDAVAGTPNTIAAARSAAGEDVR